MGFKEFYTEAKITDLRAGVNNARIKRSKDMWSRYDHINRQGTAFFNTESVTTKGRQSWQQEIKPATRPRIFAHKTLNSFRKIYNGDIHVKCNCPDFKYRFGYRASQDGYILGKKETLPSNVTNPQPRFPQGTVCKHLETALKVLKPNISTMFSDWKGLFEE